MGGLPWWAALAEGVPPRAGLVKVGQGSDLGLAPPIEWRGVPFTTVGIPPAAS